MGSRFSTPVQTGPGVHPASCTMGTGSFPGVKSIRGVILTPHPLLVLWSRKGRAIPLPPLWAIQPVQSLSACTRVHFTFTFIISAPCTNTYKKKIFWCLFKFCSRKFATVLKVLLVCFLYVFCFCCAAWW